jgi:filamentous hemagglutinin family protein
VVLRSRACLGWLALVAAFVPGAASAQHIKVDGTLSPARTLAGPHYLIDAGLGRQVGGNLFESFRIFGLTPGESAAFTGPASVDNIIGRVTGSRMSSIDGTINSKIAGANIYLVNPYGVVFGPQGRVNVSGSFYASTANYVKMANGARFQATHPKASTLTVAKPAAFGFLDAKPAAITVSGSLLEARRGGTIGLVGGPVSIRKATIAPAGAIDVASVAGKGEVPVTPRNADSLTVKRFGRVNITGGSMLKIDGGAGGGVFIRSGSLGIGASTIEADNHGARTGGEIVLEASGRIALSHGATVETVDFGRGPGGRLSVSAGRLVLTGGATVQTVAFGSGSGGRLSVSTGRLALTDGASLVTFAQGIGAAGPVDVAAGAILIDGRGDPSSQAGLGSFTLAKGQAGAVTVSAGSLSIFANGVVLSATFGGGGGNLALDVRGALTIDATGAKQVTGVVADAEAGSTGSAGDVTIVAGSLKIVDGGVISSGALAGSGGNAGGVTVRVTGAVLITGLFTGIFAQADQGSTGNAGAVRVTAGTLVVVDGGQISVSSLSGGAAGAVSVDVSGGLTITGAASVFTGIAAQAVSGSTRSAGDIFVKAGNLSIGAGGEISAATSGPGAAGNVSVDVAGRLTISGLGSGIDGNTFGTGHGGIVTVRAGALLLDDGGQISVSSVSSGAAGAVSVGVANNLTIKGGSGINSNALAANSKAAGTITVAAGSLSIENGGQISAGTSGSGKGGDISVDVSGRLTITGTAGLFTGIAAQANPGSTGSAGAVGVTAGTLVVVDGGEISSATFGTKNAGTVTVGAGALRVAAAGEITADSEAGSKGDAGKVMVAAGSLDIHGGLISSGLLAADNGLPASMGKHAGAVIVEVRGLLTIDGAGSATLHGIAADAATGTTGTSGDVRVTAGALSITDKGEIASSTFGAGRGGSVSVAVAGRLEIDGASSRALGLTGITSQANPGSRGSAGDVFVRAGSLSILGNGEISSVTFGTGNAGTVSVIARAIALASGGGIASDSEAGSSGDAGNVIIKAGSLGISDGLISSGLLAANNGEPASAGRRAGNITVEVSDLLTIVGSRSRLLAGIATDANPGTTGNAGNVHVTAAVLSIVDNGEIGSGTFGAGTGGNVFVAVSGRLKINGARSNHQFVTGIATQANPGSTDNAGDVFVRAGGLTILDGGVITSSAVGATAEGPAATGNAGKVAVLVAGELSIQGGQIATTTDPGTIGDAGSVGVRAGHISIADGGEIVSTTVGTGAGGSVTVTTRGTLLLDGGGAPGTEIAASATGPQSGPAGTVTVSAGSLTIERGAEIASTTAGLGAGGDVEVSVSGDILLTGPGREITAQSTGSGDAGTIAIAADRLLPKGGAAISTEAATSTANGGNIGMSLRDMVYLIDGEITTSVKGKTGNGGNITIASPFVILSGSDVIAQAVEGHGGNITIDAGQYIPSTDSIVSASSALGVSGNVVINGPPVALNGTLVVLSSELRSPVAVTRASCTVRAPGLQSSLVEAGRGGLSEDPNASRPALFLAGRDLRLGPRVAPRRAEAEGDLPSTLDSSLRCD